MKALTKTLMGAVVILVALAQQASAQTAVAVPARQPILYGTTGACNNPNPGGPCLQNSKLVRLDPTTFQQIGLPIGDVGHTVNGLAWDQTSGTLYASTAIGCGLVDNSTTPPTPSVCPFHGLITIDPKTGKGTPVNPNVHNFGLPGADSPIHSIAIDPLFGTMQAWYDEFSSDPNVPVTDTFVWINKHTGVATEFPDSGIDTFQNGLAWQFLPTKFGRQTIKIPHLWNINAVAGTAYEINPLPFNTLFGKPVKRVLSTNVLSPPIMAALGDFNPVDNLYYGLSFTPNFFCPTTPPCPTNVTQVDPQSGNVALVTCGLDPATGLPKPCETVKGLHVIAFVKPRL